MNVSLVVSMIYARFFHEAPLAQRAPLNDLKLQEYPDRCVSGKASAALRQHLCYSLRASRFFMNDSMMK